MKLIPLNDTLSLKHSLLVLGYPTCKQSATPYLYLSWNLRWKLATELISTPTPTPKLPDSHIYSSTLFRFWFVHSILNQSFTITVFSSHDWFSISCPVTVMLEIITWFFIANWLLYVLLLSSIVDLIWEFIAEYRDLVLLGLSFWFSFSGVGKWVVQKREWWLWSWWVAQLKVTSFAW